MKTIFAVTAALALLAFAVPASAGNLFAAGGAGVAADDALTPAAWSDTVSGFLRAGWDFGTPELALEYNINTAGYRSNKAGHDTLFLNGALHFGDGRLQPGIGAGVGISIDGLELVDDHHVQLSAGLLYYLAPDRLALTADYRWLSDIDDISDGDGQVLAGIRLDF